MSLYRVGFETLFMMTDFLKGATAAEVKAGSRISISPACYLVLYE